jgi:uncharacterized protein DUF4118
MRSPYERSRVPASLPTVCMGALIGFVIAWGIEYSGHPALAILAMFVCSVVSTYIGMISEVGGALLDWGHRRTILVKSVFVLVIMGSTLSLDAALRHNPQTYSYLSLLPAILLSAVLFGFRSGLIAVALAVLGTDAIFGQPSASFSIWHWQDFASLISFSAVTALFTSGFLILVSMYDDSISD